MASWPNKNGGEPLVKKESVQCPRCKGKGRIVRFERAELHKRHEWLRANLRVGTVIQLNDHQRRITKVCRNSFTMTRSSNSQQDKYGDTTYTVHDLAYQDITIISPAQ
jgi:transposase-like protein